MPIMPRKAASYDPRVQKAIAKIKDYCDSENTNISVLSRSAGVSQPALSRFINGERKTLTMTAEKVLFYLGTQHNWHNRHNAVQSSVSDDYGLIEEAARSLWDGSHDTAELLASLIRALKPAVDIAVRTTKRNSRRD